MSWVKNGGTTLFMSFLASTFIFSLYDFFPLRTDHSLDPAPPCSTYSSSGTTPAHQEQPPIAQLTSICRSPSLHFVIVRPHINVKFTHREQCYQLFVTYLVHPRKEFLSLSSLFIFSSFLIIFHFKNLFCSLRHRCSTKCFDVT